MAMKSLTALRVALASPRPACQHILGFVGCRPFSAAPAAGSAAEPATPSAPRRKYKSSFKRCAQLAFHQIFENIFVILCFCVARWCSASSVMAELEADAREALKLRMAKFPKFEVGDAIEVSVRICKLCIHERDLLARRACTKYWARGN